MKILELSGKLPDAGYPKIEGIQSTLYVPEGIAHPDGTVTLIAEFAESGIKSLPIFVEHDEPNPASTVTFDIEPPTPAKGTHIE